MELLKQSFYLEDNILSQSELVLGAHLVYKSLRLKIVEVEAYRGRDDLACHAYRKVTKRNRIMFEDGGKAYLYLCYGVHTLFNIVCGPKGVANSILIRAARPLEGIDLMLKNRKQKKLSVNLSNGPGKLTQAINLTIKNYGESLCQENFGLYKDFSKKEKILRGKRIGIDYAGEDKHLPWRFALDDPYVSHLNKIKRESKII